MTLMGLYSQVAILLTLFSNTFSQEYNATPTVECLKWSFGTLRKEMKEYLLDEDTTEVSSPLCQSTVCVLLWGISQDYGKAMAMAKGCGHPRVVGSMQKCPDMSEAQTDIFIDIPEGMPPIKSAFMCYCTSKHCNALENIRQLHCEDTDEGSPAICDQIIGMTKEVNTTFPLNGSTQETTIVYVMMAICTIVVLCMIFYLCVFPNPIRKSCTDRLKKRSNTERVPLQTENGGSNLYSPLHINGVAESILLNDVGPEYSNDAQECINDSKRGGKFEIGRWNTSQAEKIGQGAFAVVYKFAAQPENDIDFDVALKCVQIEHTHHFFREIRAIQECAKFGNDHVIKFVSRAVYIDEMNNRTEWRLAMEYCSGGTLEQFLQESTLNNEVFISVIRGIVSGMKYVHNSMQGGFPRDSRDLSSPTMLPNEKLHKHRIAHRDVSSKNIFVRNRATGNICIADFNLSLVDGDWLKTEAELNLGNGLGQYRYLSPELLQFSLGNLEEPMVPLIHCDMYACGLVLWECCTRAEQFYKNSSAVSDYKKPYDEVLATLGWPVSQNNISQVVVRLNRRPQFPDYYSEMKKKEKVELIHNETMLLKIVNTITTMWDEHPEARGSMSLVASDLSSLQLQ